jgi:hypothetical protein
VISKAKNEWVLILDADEEVSPELRKEILENLQNDQETVAYYIPCKNYMFRKKMHISPNPRPQLAKKGVLEFGREYVHEKIKVRDEFTKKTRRLRNPIIHHTYQNVSDYLTKFQQYTSLEALRLMDECKNPSLLKMVLIGLTKAAYLLFWKRGVLDGYRGLFFASMTFQYHLATYAKVKELKNLARKYPKEWRTIWIERECQR